jgi:hypothetical protein
MSRSTKKPTPVSQRDMAQRMLIERKGAGAGKHHTRERDVAKGIRRKGKHPEKLHENPQQYKDQPVEITLKNERLDESSIVQLAPGVNLVMQISRTGKRVPVTHGEQRLLLCLQDDQGKRVQFYQSFAGTGGKQQGWWFPTGGVMADDRGRGAWIIKGSPRTDPGAGRVPLLEFYQRVNEVLPHTDPDTDAWLMRHVGMDYGDFSYKDEYEIVPFIRITEAGNSNELQKKWGSWCYQFWALMVLDKIWGKRTFTPERVAANPYKAAIPIVSGIAYVPNPVDLEGRFIPERYLAGLPPALQKQRIRELTQSRDAYRMGDFSELPTDRAARKMGLVKESAYTTVAKKRGIEWRGDADDMASRVLTHYVGSAPVRARTELAQALAASFKKGLAAWKSGGHRPGATAQNWAVARVNSLVVGGKTAWTADKKQFAVLPDKAKEEVVAQIGDVLAALKKQNRQKDVDYLKGVLSNPIRVEVEGAPSGSEAQGRHTRFYQSRAALDRIEEQGREVVPDIKFRIVWGHKDIAPMRQKGGIQNERGERGVVTLVADASRTQRLSDANEQLGLSVGRSGKVTLYTAHTILHRLGDMIMPSFRNGYTTMNYDARISGGVKAGLIVTNRVERAWRNLHTALDKARSYLTMGAIPVEYWFVTAVDTKACRERWINDATQALAETVPYRLLYKKGRENGVKLLSDLPFVPDLEAALTEYIDASMEMLKGYQVEI